MARNPTYALSFTILDDSGEPGTFEVPVTAARVEALAGLPNADTQIAALIAAVDGVTDGLLSAIRVNTSQRLTAATVASNGDREAKILVIYSDNVTFALFRLEIPCRKYTLAKLPGETDELDQSDPLVDALKDVLNTVMVSPDGNPITVQSLWKVGRNV